MILVTGATGTVGSEAVRLLCGGSQRGPWCVTRPAWLTAAISPPRSRSSPAISIDRTRWTRPSTGWAPSFWSSPAVPAQEIAVIDSAVRQGVTHLVKITSKASADSPVDRRRGQSRIEAHLATTGLAYTLLRSNAYQQNLLALAAMVKQTRGFLMSTGEGQVGMIDARDVAAAACAIATAPSAHAGHTYCLTGPDLITYTDIAKELPAALGHEIEYRQIRPDEHRAAMVRAGVPEAVATSNAQAFGLIAEGDAAWLTEDVARLTGAAPRSLHAFITQTIAAFT